MLYGVYIGPDEGLKGRCALLRMNLDEPGWLAQFDDAYLYRKGSDACFRPLLGFRWHKFALSDFDLFDHKASRVGMGEFIRDGAEARGWIPFHDYYGDLHAHPQRYAHVGAFLLLHGDDGDPNSECGQHAEQSGSDEPS